MRRLLNRISPTWLLSWRRRRDAPKPTALTVPWNPAGARNIAYHMIEATR